MRHFFDEDYYGYMEILYDLDIPDSEEEEEEEEACYFDVPLPYQPPASFIKIPQRRSY